MDAQGWTLIIGAVFAGIVLVTNTILTWMTREEAIKAAVKARDAETKAEVASSKADASHDVVTEIKDLAVKTETQTNNRLSQLDAKVAAHEIKCIQNLKDSADQQRQIAELKLALAEAQKKSKAPDAENGS